MWQNTNNPSTSHAVIWWESLEHWSAIPKRELPEVMEAMSEHEHETTLSTFNLIRYC
jgi:hypothetical protein